MQPMSRAEYNALLRQEFGSFGQRSFHEVNPSAVFAWNWHHELMSAKLADCYRRKTRRLIINISPRHLKSLYASVALPAWWLGHDPAAQILCVSYGQDLAEKHARDCRTIMTSCFYQRAFSTRLSPHKQSAQEFVTTEQGFRFATSVGGALTGRGGDLIIIDDPLKPEEALSDSQRKFVNDWYDHTLLSRLNNKQTGCIIIVMHRLHLYDLVGHVTGREPWEVIALPAIAERDETHAIDTPLGQVRFYRKRGEPLHPAREPQAAIEDHRNSVGEYVFAAQYQQAPLACQGLIRKEWIDLRSTKQMPASYDLTVQSWDTGNKLGPDCSYSVCITVGVKGEHFYLRDVRRERMDYRNLKRAVRDHARTFGAQVVLIEDKASGTQLIQELRAEGMHGIQARVPQGDKAVRMQAQAGLIENGFVHAPSDALWLAEYLRELTTYPASKFDDQVDATSQFLDWSKTRSSHFPQQGIYDYYRLEAEKLLPSSRVKMRVPRLNSLVITMLGRPIREREGQIIEVTNEEAQGLRTLGFVKVDDSQ